MHISTNASKHQPTLGKKARPLTDEQNVNFAFYPVKSVFS